IFYNGRDGVSIASGVNNLISHNRIAHNGDLGIDLDPAGVTLNDSGDSDSGANNQQNYPVIHQAVVNGSTATISATLNSQTNTTYPVQFFANTTCDNSGYGQGGRLLSLGEVTTDSSGNGDASKMITSNLFSTMPFLTMVAIDPNNNTSEFSACVEVIIPMTDLSIHKSVNSSSLIVGQPVTYTIAFTNNGLAKATGIIITDSLPIPTAIEAITIISSGATITQSSSSSAQYSWQVEALDSGQSGLITIAGQVTATHGATLTNSVVITSVSGESNEADNQAEATATAFVLPTLSINDIDVIEENSGTVSATFTITLSVPPPLDVTVDYTTSDGTALASNSDYIAQAGTVLFTAGVTTTQIQVQVNGDTIFEPDETFFVNLSNLSYGTIVDNSGMATIINDDAVVTPTTISLVGSSLGAPGIAYNFDTTVNPSNTTQPITYSWQATDQAGIVQSRNAFTDSQNFTWAVTGTKVITLAITNESGVVITTTHTITISAGAEAALSVVITDSADPVTLGNSVTYVITVTNQGPLDATGLTITNTLPGTLLGLSNASLQISSLGCSLVGVQFICSLSTPLPAGDILVIPLGPFSPDTTGTLTTNVEVSANETDNNLINNVATETTNVIDAISDLMIQKSAPTSVVAGNPLTFTMIVRNNGPATAFGVTLVDPLPPNVTSGSAVASQGSCQTTPDNTLNCVLNTLAASASATVTAVVTPTAGGALTNIASISASIGTDPNPANNSAAAIVTVEGITIDVNPTTTTTLVYNNPNGGGVTVIIPVGSVPNPITLVYTPLAAPKTPTVPGTFAGRAFLLEAYQGSMLLPNYSFQKSLLISIEYAEADITDLDTTTLILYGLQSTGWINAAATCTPQAPYTYDSSKNQVNLAICRTMDEFTLTGSGANQVHLPVILKSN
ncbi:MAG: Calx-beta domain-containing protein, partial [Chloroflexota bacterium]